MDKKDNKKEENKALGFVILIFIGVAFLSWLVITIIHSIFGGLPDYVIYGILIALLIYITIKH